MIKKLLEHLDDPELAEELHIRGLYQGHQFNEKFSKKTFYKITNSEENHYGLQYNDGVHQDHLLQINPEVSISQMKRILAIG